MRTRGGLFPLFLDKHMMCLNKPAGVLSQKQDKSGVANAEALAASLIGGKLVRAVHRLDKNASGCLLLGRTEEAVPSDVLAPLPVSRPGTHRTTARAATPQEDAREKALVSVAADKVPCVLRPP